MTEDLQELFDRPIRELEPPAPVCLEVGSRLGEALSLMQRHSIGCLLVRREGRLAGIVTERDFFMKVIGRGVDLESAIDAFMTRDPESLHPDDSIAFALNRMSLGGYRHVPLVDEDGHPVGIISVRDIVDYVVEHHAALVYNLPPEPRVHSNAREGA